MRTKQNRVLALEFLNQIQAPNRKISADKIYASGYRVIHPDPNAEVVKKMSD